MRLIDKDAVLKAFEDVRPVGFISSTAGRVAYSIVSNFDEVGNNGTWTESTARTLKKAEWQAQACRYNSLWRCSSCHELFNLDSGHPKANGYNFCPACGATMSDEVEP